MMKKLTVLSLMLLYSGANGAMESDSSGEGRSLIETPKEVISQLLKTEVGSISAALIDLRDHLVKDGESYQTTDQIKDILVTLKSVRQQANSEVFRPALEYHFDEIQAAAQANHEYYAKSPKSWEGIAKELYIKDFANAKANEMKITRFCDHLKAEYDVFRNGVPALK